MKRDGMNRMNENENEWVNECIQPPLPQSIMRIWVIVRMMMHGPSRQPRTRHVRRRRRPMVRVRVVPRARRIRVRRVVVATMMPIPRPIHPSPRPITPAAARAPVRAATGGRGGRQPEQVPRGPEVVGRDVVARAVGQRLQRHGVVQLQVVRRDRRAAAQRVQPAAAARAARRRTAHGGREGRGRRGP